MRKGTKIVGSGCATLIGAVVIGLIVLGSISPDVGVYPGRQIPKKYMETIRSLNLLEEGEQIKYFYSDAVFDIKTGLYFVTDKNLVLYSSEWAEPETIIPLDQISSVEAEYDDSFWSDTMVYVRTCSDTEVVFPVSSEKGLDKKFVEAVKKNLNVEAGTPAD